MSDDELLESFITRGDADAFRLMVEHHTPLVYAAARRQVHDAHLAEDVTQAVFILLARKAKSVRRGTLAGWLVNATRLAAREARRRETRLKAREKRVAESASTSREEETMPTDEHKLDRFVDEALGRLGAADRAAVTLRYLQNKSQRQVAEAMGVSEDAAAKRLSRAMAKLRAFFTRKGALLPGIAVAESFSHLRSFSPPQILHTPPHVLP